MLAKRIAGTQGWEQIAQVRANIHSAAFHSKPAEIRLAQAAA
jgi:hypothetical protein